TSPTTGYLDNTLITGTEDSLVMLYRQGAGYDWTLVNSFTRNTGANPTDKRGTITIDTLMIGEYTLGYYDYTVGIQELNSGENLLMNVTPNPSTDLFTFNFSNSLKKECQLVIMDMGGRKVHSEIIKPGTTNVSWNCIKNSSGVYFAMLLENGVRKAGVRLVIGR